jgi:hypothetical protein
VKIRVKDANFLSYAKEKLYATKHFENILLILLHQDFKQHNKKMFKYLTNPEAMRAVIAPQMATLLGENNEYYAISTWLGLKYVKK